METTRLYGFFHRARAAFLAINANPPETGSGGFVTSGTCRIALRHRYRTVRGIVPKE